MSTFLSGVMQNAVLVTVLAVFVWGVTRLVRRPALASVLWLLVLVKLLTPPLLSVPLPALGAREARPPDRPPPRPVPPADLVNLPADPMPAGDAGEEPTPQPVAPVPAEPVRASWVEAIRWEWAVVAVWAVGSLAWVGFAGWRIRRFRKVLRLATPATDRVAALTTETAARLGLGRTPAVLVVEAQVSPMVWPAGWRPLLVLPRGLVDQLDDERLAMVIGHELAHVRRRDHLVRWFELAVLALFWWHPVAWWACRQRAAAADQCCDAVVLELETGKAWTYAETLLQAAEFLAGQGPAPLPANAIGTGGSLEQRCRRVLAGTLTPRLGWTGRVLALVAAAVLPVSCHFSQRERSAADSEGPDVTALGRINDHLDNPFRIQPYLRVAVQLQAMEETERVAWLTRWAEGGRHDEQVVVLCRMLFEAKDGREFRRPRLGAPAFLGKEVAGGWPLEPIAVFRGVPIIVVRGYTLAGLPEPASDYLKYCLETCRWTSRKYAEIDDDELEKRLDEFVVSAALARRQLTAAEVQFVKQQGGFSDDFALYVGVAGIDPKAADRVIALLDGHGIPNIVEGSVVYGVSVPPSHAERALALLKADAAKGGYHAVFRTPEQIQKEIAGRTVVRAGYRDWKIGGDWKPVDLKAAAALDQFVRRYVLPYRLPPGWNGPAPQFAPPTHEAFLELKNGTRIEYELMLDLIVINRREGTPEKLKADRILGWERRTTPRGDIRWEAGITVINNVIGKSVARAEVRQAGDGDRWKPADARRADRLDRLIRRHANPVEFFTSKGKQVPAVAPTHEVRFELHDGTRVRLKLLTDEPLVVRTEEAAGKTTVDILEGNSLLKYDPPNHRDRLVALIRELLAEPPPVRNNPAPPAAEGRATRPVAEAETIVAGYVLDWGRSSPPRGPNLITAIWGDGKVVWSKDRVRGGAPYLTGHIDPQKLTALVARLERDGVFADQALGDAHFGPDSQFTTVVVNSGKRRLKMESWHELFEANEKLVATSRGISSLDGRRREDVLREDTADYRHFRSTWDGIRAAVGDLIPAQGEATAGALVQEDGVVSWRE